MPLLHPSTYVMMFPSLRNVINFLYDGHALNLVNLDFDIYMSYTIAALVELPANLLVIWPTDNLGRKFSGFSSLILSGTAMMASGVLIGN